MLKGGGKLKNVEIYQTRTGKEPFKEWLLRLSVEDQAYILRYIERIAKGGSKKNIKSLGDGIFEVKMTKGSAYRVYFGELDNVIILLLLGGDKRTQKRDIKKAKEYWRDQNV